MIGTYEGMTRISDLFLGTKFLCLNGNWNGEIVEVNGSRYMQVKETGKLHSISIEDELQVVLYE